ncbi:MAG: CRISPR-associated endonuclease Cas1 [Syntrophomonadaceae bacterium]|nr:CRISPR-associated endonuclease Cas1 [Syntrophomonadaceae bacterium]
MILYLNEAGSVLRKTGGYYVVITADNKKRDIPAEKLEAVVVFSGANVTTPCLMSLLRQGVTVTFLSSKGGLFGRAESTAHFNIERHRSQFRAGENPGFCLELARIFIKGKIHNELVVLRRYNRHMNLATVDDAVKRMRLCYTDLDKPKSLNELNGTEGYASRLYFGALSHMVREEFRFKGRTRQPPKDPFNSLLSFGYTLLMYEIYAVLLGKGLHPYLGFLHRVRRGHPALASDLMEEWRPILVDSLVLRLIQGRTLTLDDFELPDVEGGVYLRKDRARVFIEKFQERLNLEHRYLPTDAPLTFRQAIHYQVGALVKALEESNPRAYQPIMLR